VDCALDELLSEVRGQHDGGDNGYTTNEIAEKLGCSGKTAALRLHALDRAGRLQCGRARRRTIDGRWTSVPVYSLKERAPENGAKK